MGIEQSIYTEISIANEEKNAEKMKLLELYIENSCAVHKEHGML